MEPFEITGNVNIKLELQEMYDNLGVYIESLQAQRDILGKSLSVCTHPARLYCNTEIDDGRTITTCECGAIINATGDIGYYCY